MTEPLLRHLIGEQLRLARLERGETLKQVADRAGVSTPYLSEIERGRKEPSSEILSALAGSLDSSLLDLSAGVVERLAPSQASQVSQGEFRLAA